MPAKPRNPRTNQYTLGRKEHLMDLEVPSGALCQVRRPGPMGLIKAGLLDNLDILGSIVQTEHVDRVEGRQSEEDDETKQLRQAQELMADKEKLLHATALIEGVVAHCVVQPELVPTPADPNEPRDPDRVYVDSVDFEDQVFIFQFVVGGTADLASFRQEFGKTLGGLGSEQAVPDSTKPNL